MHEKQPIIIHGDPKGKPVGVLVSGERLSGKDTFSKLLSELLADHDIRTAVRSTANHLKERFCGTHGLDAQRFLTDREYKEAHRQEFADWVLTQPEDESFREFMESIRNDLLLLEVIIISDLRNPSDFEQFSFIFPAFLSVRITATEETRRVRGYEPSQYDRSVFETQFNRMPADITVHNDGTTNDLRIDTAAVSEAILTHLSQ